MRIKTRLNLNNALYQLTAVCFEHEYELVIAEAPAGSLCTYSMLDHMAIASLSCLLPWHDLSTEFSVNIIDMLMPPPKCWIPSYNNGENNNIYEYDSWTNCAILAHFIMSFGHV